MHKIRVRLFLFAPEHRHGIQIKIAIDINHHRPLCYGPGRAASRATDWKRAISLSVRFSPGGDQSRLDQRFCDFKGAQEEAAKAAKRVRHEKPYDYKKKAHEEQATFNAKVQDALKEATDHLAERQKLIKIADRSANGWGVVAEYTADELAADSDDEKRLEKAEKAAERKAGLKRRQPAQRGAAQTRTQRYTAAQAYGGYTVPQLYPPSFPQLQQTASGAGQSVRRAGGSAGTIQRVSVGPCFACGEMGHLRMYCPKIQTQEKK